MDLTLIRTGFAKLNHYHFNLNSYKIIPYPTIEVPHRTHILKADCCLKAHNSNFKKLASPIRMLFLYISDICFNDFQNSSPFFILYHLLVHYV